MTTRVQAWLKQADSYLTVGQLTEANGFHRQACYHYSQAAEKALKGALISLGVLPTYSHSLDRLINALDQQGVKSNALKELHVKALSRMSSETRNPQDDEAPVDRFDAKDSVQARTIAGGILIVVKSILKPEGNV